MENCKRCKNSEIKAGDNYCKICGLDLKGATAATAAQKISVHMPENLKVSEVVEQLEEFKKQFIRSIPLNF